MDTASKPFLHLALQWQGQNDSLMLTCFHRERIKRLPGCFVSDMQRFSPGQLVVLKAWCGEQEAWDCRFLELFIKDSSAGAWLRRSFALDEWLAGQESLSYDLRKEYGLSSIPGVIWRPLAPSKAELREAQQFPQWVKTAFGAALYILGHNAVPLTTAEVTEQCNGVYSEKTVRKALSDLRALGLAKASKAKGERASWLLLPSGENTFRCHQEATAMVKSSRL